MATEKSAVDAARFAQGLTYEDYFASIESNREEFAARYQEVEIRPEDREYFARVAQNRGSIKVVAIAEDWCPDVVNNLPVIARIAESAPAIELRVFPRDKNLDIMDRYLNKGQYRSVPTLVFFDGQFNELGRWIERPAAATQLTEELRAEFAKLGLPEEQVRQERRRRMAEAYRERLTQETVREIREVLS